MLFYFGLMTNVVRHKTITCGCFLVWYFMPISGTENNVSYREKHMFEVFFEKQGSRSILVKMLRKLIIVNVSLMRGNVASPATSSFLGVSPYKTEII